MKLKCPPPGVQTRFVEHEKPLIDTFLVTEVIISYDNFIAIDPMKKFGARFSSSDFPDNNLAGNKNLV